MALKRTMEEGGGLKLDPGTYPVTCFDVRAEKLDKFTFGDGRVIRFILEVDDTVDEDGGPVYLDPIANDKLTPKSKLTEWLNAFGVAAAVGEAVDLESCIGKRALAVIGIKPGKDGSGEFSSVDSILPAQKAKAAPSTVAEMSIGDWWKHTRELGIERAALIQASEDIYSAEPKDLTGDQRAELLEKV